jgi:peptide-methionine (S)-S-oxide reductase
MRFRSSNITADNALPGHPEPIVVTRPHLQFGTSMLPPFGEGSEIAYFALGCFWGAEKIFFQTPGVLVTAVGYQGGFTPNPTYREVCTGRTGHTEAVEVVFDPKIVRYAELVKLFFESHDPTQGDRQGADVGTQYRSAIYTTNSEQESVALGVEKTYGEQLASRGYGAITTEIAPAGPFYMAEEYHQQYLLANPNGYCGIGGTGVSCPIGLAAN